ncbi:MAG: hypothetical protein BWX60_00964 [Candidatus Marinimicrobia bacterium ADurb.Bin030]|nr:MAG: hypothetical protein BWX60_00964 [Candidatus Marinimicrobia bacterium ADurb.Bin030]
MDEAQAFEKFHLAAHCDRFADLESIFDVINTVEPDRCHNAATVANLDLEKRSAIAPNQILRNYFSYDGSVHTDF